MSSDAKSEQLIEISIAEQSLSLINAGEVIHRYSISTGKAGVSEQRGSGGTPRGWHKIRAWIGADAPINSVFVGRRATGEIYSEALARQFPERDWVLSRILWLSGLEPGKNRLGMVDSMARFIYLHGTPDDQPMGVPRSHGCIRMRNHDIVEMFPLLSANVRVNIF